MIEIMFRNKKNEYHRINGPSCVISNGHFFWFNNNELHREDGPAIYYNEKYTYYLNNEYYSKEHYYKKIRNYD